MSIFELPHVFVVFHPGAGGNFISSLIEKIMLHDTSTVSIGLAGSAHTIVNKKIEGTDYLSFGTEVDEHSLFKDESTRINYYVDKIKENYHDVTMPQVVWSHDFTNIPLYKKYFPNSKIIALTQDTSSEKVAVVLLHVIKNILDVNAVNPVTPKRMDEILQLWNYGMKIELNRAVGEEIAKTLSTDNILVKHLSFSKMMSYYKLMDFLDFSVDNQDVVNNILYPNKALLLQGKAPYTVGGKYSDYTLDCITLPFKYLMTDDPTLLVETLSKIVNTDNSKNIIMTNYALYRNAQNKEILEDPVKYYNKIKTEGLQELNRLNTL